MEGFWRHGSVPTRPARMVPPLPASSQRAHGLAHSLQGEFRQRRAPLFLTRMVPPARSRRKAEDAPTLRRGRSSWLPRHWPVPAAAALCPPPAGSWRSRARPAPPAASAANKKQNIMIIVINKYRPRPSAGLSPVGVRQSRQAARRAARGVLRARGASWHGYGYELHKLLSFYPLYPCYHTYYSLFILYMQFIIISYVDMIINRVKHIPYLLYGHLYICSHTLWISINHISIYQ